jgi:hypothetical protein
VRIETAYRFIVPKDLLVFQEPAGLPSLFPCTALHYYIALEIVFFNKISCPHKTRYYLDALEYCRILILVR